MPTYRRERIEVLQGYPSTPPTANKKAPKEPRNGAVPFQVAVGRMLNKSPPGRIFCDDRASNTYNKQTVSVDGAELLPQCVSAVGYPRYPLSGRRMTAPPLTRASLLVRLHNPNDTAAWTEFVRLYASVIYGFARQRGRQDADAADLMQEVLRAVARNIPSYEKSKGSFRGWLYTITRNKLYNQLDSQKRHPRGSGDSDAQRRLDEQPGRENAEDTWDREYERKAFMWAADRIRNEFQESTWKAFWLTAVDGLAAKDVGQQLGLSPGAVYVAKSRVLARLREEIELLPQQ